MMLLKTIAAASVVAALAAAPALAQQSAPAQQPVQTGSLPYGPPITLEMAKKAMAAAEQEAIRNNWSVVIAIVDSGGHLVMLHRMDDAQLSSIAMAQGKAETAISFKRPTKALEDAIAGGGAGLRLTTIRSATPIEGGIPIVIDGKIGGAIGVSGLAGNSNTQVARAGIDALGK